MLIPPKYRLTSKISELLSSIEASREVIDSISLPPEIERNIRRQSTLKSSLFSARIEGNDLTLEEMSLAPSKDQKKIEVQNILKALNWIREQNKKTTEASDILTLHEIVIKGASKKEHKNFRTNMEAIFNSSGIAIYMPPPPRLINSYVNKLLRFINSDKETLVPIRACIAHYCFEKIHPFLDGNGRVGRILMQMVLNQGGYGMKGLLTIEEYLENHRSEYYQSLEEPEKDATDYIIFMLGAIEDTARKTKEIVLSKQKAKEEDFLLPRRAEILRIIKDHKIVNFDQIKRRFMAVNARTLRFDLKRLSDLGFVRKLGATNGVYYEAKDDRI